MDSWNIIGWVIISVSLVILISRIFCWLAYKVFIYVQHFKTRNTPLREGQVWIQNGKELKIGKRHENGRTTIRFGCASWSDSDDEWKWRTRQTPIYLVNSGK
jgi:hypothetical protein